MMSYMFYFLDAASSISNPWKGGSLSFVTCNYGGSSYSDAKPNG